MSKGLEGFQKGHKRFGNGALGKHWKIKNRKPWTLEHKNHLRQVIRKKCRRGKECNFWKGGIATLTNLIRHSFKYRQWISDIFTRDNYICQKCGQRGGNLDTHHIKKFSIILMENNIKTLQDALACEELWNINNGLTLCRNCHKLIHKKK